MRKPLLPIILAAVLGSNPGASATEPARSDVFLTLARLEAVKDVKTAPEIYTPGEIPVGGVLQQEFRVLKVLIGRAHRRSLVLSFHRLGWPVPGFDYFLIVKRTSDGPIVVWWDATERGLCVDVATATGLGLVGAIHALQRKYPCTEWPRDAVR